MGQHLNKNKFMSMLGPYLYENITVEVLFQHILRYGKQFII